MKIAFKASLRNGALVKWRIDNGNLTQAEACRRLGIRQQDWCKVETFRVTWSNKSIIGRIAAAIGELPEDIYPPELLGVKVVNEAVAIEDVGVEALIAFGSHNRYVALSPIEDVSRSECRELLAKALGYLPHRLRVALEMHYGIGLGIPHTYREIGKALGISRARVRQIIFDAHRRLSASPHANMAHDVLCEE